ncbi:MAG: 30S ribosomal protein S6 [Pseudomonadota bacterium]|nr:30S ribosomal protein S6 [Pseudomonadota bacterium]|tara:strand:+ start:1608 stop:2045 length:438 start_codon:yes stop_codon:yes gene_type:complete
MAIYECVYIARQELTAAQAEQLSKDLTKIVSSNSGEIKRQEYWGLRNLAYKIRKNRKGHYTMFHIEAPASTIEELERNMRLNEDILRYLTVKIDKLPEGPSVMMTARPDRPRRTDRYEDNVSVKDTYGGNPQTDGEVSPERTSSN